MTFDEHIYWLLKEIEERQKDGGLETNFSLIYEAPKQYKLSTNLYPSLLDDPDSDGYRSNARKALEDQ